MNKKKRRSIEWRAEDWFADFIAQRTRNTGTEVARYALVCLDCGQKGFCVESLNEWGGVSTSWEGFLSVLPRSKRLIETDDSDAMDPRCICGSTRITRAEAVRILRNKDEKIAK